MLDILNTPYNAVHKIQGTGPPPLKAGETAFPHIDPHSPAYLYSAFSSSATHGLFSQSLEKGEGTPLPLLLSFSDRVRYRLLGIVTTVHHLETTAPSSSAQYASQTTSDPFPRHPTQLSATNRLYLFISSRRHIPIELWYS